MPKKTEKPKKIVDENPRITGDNVAPLQKEALEAMKQVDKLEEERKAINDKIGAIRSDMEAKGIAKPAFDAARRYMKMNEDKREGYDIAYSLVREAGGMPVQADLFDK